MKKRQTKIIISILLLSILSVPVFAQRGGSIGGSTQQNPGLTVNCNVQNATVEIKKAEKYASVLTSGTTPFTAQIDPGSYTVTVSAPGYESQEQSINFRNSMTLNFNLGAVAPAKASLQIRSNVRDAKVVITGDGLSGQLVGSAPFTAQLALGRYRLTVSAPGYQSTAQDLNLSSSQNIDINLSPDSYSLRVTSNVDNAKVFIRGGEINGQITGTTDMTTTLSRGRYIVKVNAPGYFAEEQTVVLDESTTVNIQLRPRTGRLEVIVPNNILDYSVSNPGSRVKIYDNGIELNGTSAQLSTGQHTIRITSGAFASQQTINVKAGESYRIELNFGFDLIKE